MAAQHPEVVGAQIAKKIIFKYAEAIAERYDDALRVGNLPVAGALYGLHEYMRRYHNG